MSDIVKHTEVTKEDFSVEFALKSLRIGFPVIKTWIVGWSVPVCIQKLPGFEATWLNPPVCVLQPGEGFTVNWQEPECIQLPSNMFIAAWESPECIVENTGFNVSWESPECVQTQVGISASWQTPECVQVLADQFVASWETPECIQEQVGFTTSWESPECIQTNIGLTAQWESPECIQESIGFTTEWQFPECIQSQVGFNALWESPECVQESVGYQADWNTPECIQEQIGITANWESPECIQEEYVSDLQVGDTYEGGQIFYIFNESDNEYEPDKVKGLVFNDPAVSKAFGCSGVVVGTDMFNGSANTPKIADACGADNAALYCQNFESAGFADWYLPASSELMRLADSGLSTVPEDVEFLSSTEPSGSEADYAVSVKRVGSSNASVNKLKTDLVRVIPIRMFTKSIFGTT
jgi:hypothetical protein